eukprot:5044526-Pyramimonas_sp.AAC.1
MLPLASAVLFSVRLLVPLADVNEKKLLSVLLLLGVGVLLTVVLLDLRADVHVELLLALLLLAVAPLVPLPIVGKKLRLFIMLPLAPVMPFSV